jgi:hypothetical protein
MQAPQGYGVISGGGAGDDPTRKPQLGQYTAFAGI